MQITSSYGVELRKQNIPIRQTLDVYRSAVSYLVEIYAQVWEELEGILEAKKRFNEAEHLIHTTKKNQARFDFDIRFQKMPSYLRRAAIQHALGSVSSYKTRLGLWKKTGQRESKPKLVYENHAMPVFYRDVMYREDKEGKDAAYLKLYDGHDWKWFHVRLRHTDMEYLRKNWSKNGRSAPSLWFSAAMSSGLAVMPRISVPGSPGVRYIMVNTRNTAPSRTGIVRSMRLIMYLYIILPPCGSVEGPVSRRGGISAAAALRLYFTSITHLVKFVNYFIKFFKKILQNL